MSSHDESIDSVSTALNDKLVPTETHKQLPEASKEVIVRV